MPVSVSAPTSRRKTLDSFSYAPTALCIAMREFPRRMWFFKPAPGRRSIHEMILHMADSEAVDYVFCRQIIATGCASGTPNVEPWMDTLGYFHQGTREALKIIHSLRAATSKLLHTVPEPCWLVVAHHPVYGEITFEEWLSRKERQIPGHIQQMRENCAAWLQKNPPRKRPFESSREPGSIAPPNSTRLAASSHHAPSSRLSSSPHHAGSPSAALAAPPSKMSQSFC
jgi:hypothetical protein